MTKLYVNLGNFDCELLRWYRGLIEREKLHQKMLDYEKADQTKGEPMTKLEGFLRVLDAALRNGWAASLSALY